MWAENNEFDPTLYRNFNQKSTYSSKTRPKGLSDPKVEEMKGVVDKWFLFVFFEYKWNTCLAKAIITFLAVQ